METNEQGYTLIVSVIVISIVLLLAGVITARRLQDGFLTSATLDSHIRAQMLSEGCADVALLRIATDSSYAGDETVSIQGETCTIMPIVGNVIDIESQQNDQWYRLRITLSTKEPPNIDRWEYISDF